MTLQSSAGRAEHYFSVPGLRAMASALRAESALIMERSQEYAHDLAAPISTWTGQSAEAYHVAHNGWMRSLENQARTLAYIATSIDAVADGYLEATKELQTIWQASETGAL